MLRKMNGTTHVIVRPGTNRNRSRTGVQPRLSQTNPHILTYNVVHTRLESNIAKYLVQWLFSKIYIVGSCEHYNFLNTSTNSIFYLSTIQSKPIGVNQLTCATYLENVPQQIFQSSAHSQNISGHQKKVFFPEGLYARNL